MGTHAFPQHPSRRPRRRRTLPQRSRPQALLDTVLGPPGHRRPALYHIAIVLLVLIAAMALAGRPATPATDMLNKSHLGTIAASHQPAD